MPLFRVLSGCCCKQLFQHRPENAAIAVIANFYWRIDTADGPEADHLTVVCRGFNGYFLLRGHGIGNGHGIFLQTGQTKTCDRLTVGKLQRQDAHADEIAAMDSFETFRNDHPDAQ